MGAVFDIDASELGFVECRNGLVGFVVVDVGDQQEAAAAQAFFIDMTIFAGQEGVLVSRPDARFLLRGTRFTQRRLVVNLDPFGIEIGCKQPLAACVGVGLAVEQCGNST